MYGASENARQVADRAIWSTALSGALAILAALLFSLVLADRIVQPLRSFMAASSQISSGDYSVRVSVETSDELGQLASEFNRMSGQLEHYHEINIDQVVSERNKSEAVLTSIEDGLVVFDTELKVTAINPAALRVLAREFSPTVPLTCRDLFPESHVCELIAATVGTGSPPDIPDDQRIMTLPAPNGSRHHMLSVTPIRGRDRALIGVVLLLKDVTRLKEVERLKSDFIMAASHELRTPITGLGMSIDLLQEHAAPNLSDTDRELLQAAHEEVHRLRALINDLLDLSRIEAGRIELQFESVPISVLLDHAAAVFRNQLAMKGTTLEVKPTEGLPSVRADANKITWVLSNLISNALRYVEKGGLIVLSAQEVGGQVHFSVKDDGPGIPPEYHSLIFQKFVQVKGRESGGTGLGLAICKEIVRAHGGGIWLQSTPGQGSAFTFALPVAR